MILVDLPIGALAVIQQVNAEPELYKRLYALGLRPGGKIEVIRQATFGGPLHIRVGTTDLVLRKNLADYVIVEVL